MTRLAKPKTGDASGHRKESYFSTEVVNAIKAFRKG